MKLNRDITLDEIMRRWPDTVAVFMEYRMLCIGCPISGFHTIVDAARQHDAELERFEDTLQEVINAHHSSKKQR